ncbi:DUF1702 family protein [Salinispora arenicola]|uniref:Enediyne biosynthesis protein n=1 Tax=Salinispora arenicola (strain CNS-205) TaxID=391037 RepID=A8M108_SALAI|nr:DUF1702 family protein [Salinispora arenicola]NIL55904.1 DUF1702 family protein [Salinispora arenicola]NIL60590.1 DUF1702 family protein [Salinispora arenicola]
MPTTLGTLRRMAMAPSLAQVSFAGRGFPVRPSAATRHLEAIPQAVVCGFEWGIEGRDLWEVQRRLDLVDAEHRGFAYEGATMAFTVRDAIPGGHRHWARDLLSGPAVPHTFLTYIGIGFAMARLPRPLWRSVLPNLTGTPYYPVMSWLAVDGYGFDKAYFDTTRWVTQQERPRPYPWLGRPDYFPRAFDQGVGRALWFIHGGRPSNVAPAVECFDATRRADLWSGVGLAATFAGGWDDDGPQALAAEAGPYRAHLAQGSVFAAKARAYSGTVPSCTETAVQVLAGMTVTDADTLADEVAVGGVAAGSEPDYEVWRERIRQRCAQELGLRG